MPSYSGIQLHEGLARVVREEGASALLTGLKPTLLGYGIEGALKFGAYERVKAPLAALLVRLGAGGSALWLGPLLAGLLAGAIASLVVAPAEATRIRQVSDPDYAGAGMLGAAGLLFREGGPGGALVEAGAGGEASARP